MNLIINAVGIAGCLNQNASIGKQLLQVLQEYFSGIRSKVQKGFILQLMEWDE